MAKSHAWEVTCATRAEHLSAHVWHTHPTRGGDVASPHLLVAFPLFLLNTIFLPSKHILEKLKRKGNCAEFSPSF